MTAGGPVLLVGRDCISFRSFPQHTKFLRWHLMPGVVVCLRRKRFTTESAEDTEAEMENPLGQECACARRQDGLSVLREEGLEDLGAVVEDAADVGGDEEGIDERAAEDGVVDVVGDLGATVL
jgi:hypothetical protein